jgi:hypothetical protein
MAFSTVGLFRILIAALVYNIVLAGFVDASSLRVPIRQRLVEAVSTTRLCPNLHVNRAIFEQLARRQRMRITPGSRDMRIFEQEVEAQVPRLLRFHRGIICGLAKADFGPHGLIVRNLLRVQ